MNTGRFIKIAFPKVPRSLSGSAAVIADHDNQEMNESEPRYNASDLVGCRTVFLKNLPYDVSEKEIQETLQVCGPIGTIRLAAWNHTRSQKGKSYSHDVMMIISVIYCNYSMSEILTYVIN